MDAPNLAFNLTWHDWLNLKNLLLVSKSIRAAAVAREDSRGAHFRSDFPDVRDLDRSRYTCVDWRDGRFEIDHAPGRVHAREAGRDAAQGGDCRLSSDEVTK